MSLLAKVVYVICWSIGLTVFGLGAFFSLWAYSIYYRVIRLPRSEMFLCPKHGALLPKDCIKWLDTEQCPYCFHENMNQAEKIGIAQYLKHRGSDESWKLLPPGSKTVQ